MPSLRPPFHPLRGYQHIRASQSASLTWGSPERSTKLPSWQEIPGPSVRTTEEGYEFSIAVEQITTISAT